jgi:uncharacterized DUF497 family protein
MYVFFTWDEAKNSANSKKHSGITFQQAQEVFDDPCHVVLENYFIVEGGEQRLQAIGLSRRLLMLLVIFVDRSSNDEITIHIVSARKAEAYEKAIYERQFR